MNTTSSIESLLLVTASARGAELQEALQARLRIPVLAAASLVQAAEQLAGSQHRAIVLDEALCDLEPESAERFLAHCTEEFPVFIRPAISSAARCAAQVECGLRRMEMEKQAALRAMQKQVHAQVRDALTAILLYGPLALQAPGLAPETIRNISSMVEAAETLRRALEAPAG